MFSRLEKSFTCLRDLLPLGGVCLPAADSSCGCSLLENNESSIFEMHKRCVQLLAALVD